MGGLAIVMATSITPAQYRITLGVVGFMTVLGTALLIFGDVFLKAAWASRTWPTATATVGAGQCRGRSRLYEQHVSPLLLLCGHLWL